MSASASAVASRASGQATSSRLCVSGGPISSCATSSTSARWSSPSGCDLPYATVLVSATGAFVRPEIVAGPLDEVRAEHGLPPDPGLAMLSRYLVLTPFPSSLRDPAVPLPTTAHHMRLLTADAGRGEAALRGRRAEERADRVRHARHRLQHGVRRPVPARAGGTP